MLLPTWLDSFLSNYIISTTRIIVGSIVLIYLIAKAIDVITNKQNTSPSNSSIPSPHGIFTHPHKTYIDIIISLIFERISNYSDMMNYPPNTMECLPAVMKVRDRLGKMADSGYNQKLANWSRDFDGGLTERVVIIPRRGDVLFEKENDDTSTKTNTTTTTSEELEGVRVRICAPTAIMNCDDNNNNNNNNNTNTNILKQISTLDSSLPVLLWFDGGGMIMRLKYGPVFDFWRYLHDNSTTTTKQQQSFVILMVEYRLAPEHPFPSSVIDALSVLSHLVTVLQFKNINIAGVSAGGNLAMVTTLEGYRRYSSLNVIRSAFVQDPFLDPCCDSLSYYMNGKSSNAAPVRWLRWCWRCYLRLDNDDHDDEVTKKKENKKIIDCHGDSLDERKNRGSNRSCVARRRRSNDYNHDNMWRLASPLIDIPTCHQLDDDCRHHPPKIIVTIAKGDPLCDEGIELAEALRKHNWDCHLFESKGSHFLGFMLDKVTQKEALDEWCRVGMFGNK